MNGVSEKLRELSEASKQQESELESYKEWSTTLENAVKLILRIQSNDEFQFHKEQLKFMFETKESFFPQMKETK